MTAFRLSDFPDPPEGSGFATDVDYPVGKNAVGTVVYVKPKPEKNSFSLKIVDQIDGQTQYAIWHNVNLSGEYGYIGKGQLVALFGESNLVPDSYDAIAEALKGAQVSFTPEQNGDWVNAKKFKVTKSVKDIKASEGLGASLGAPAAAAPAPAAAPAAEAAPAAPAAQQAPVTAPTASSPAGDGDPF